MEKLLTVTDIEAFFLNSDGPEYEILINIEDP